MRFSLFVSLLVCLAGISGCKKSSPLVGTWKVDKAGAVGIALETEATFNADGTFTAVTTSNNPNSPTKLTATDKGTWKLEGANLTTVIKSVDWAFTGPDQVKIQKGKQMFEANKDQILANANAHPTETITWKGDNEFSYARDGKTITFRRS